MLGRLYVNGDEICAEMEASCAGVYYISVSWLNDTDDKELYMFKDYAVYCRTKRKGYLDKKLKTIKFLFLYNLVQLFIPHPMV